MLGKEHSLPAGSGVRVYYQQRQQQALWAFVWPALHIGWIHLDQTVAILSHNHHKCPRVTLASISCIVPSKLQIDRPIERYMETYDLALALGCAW
jgi:hypothetical protein